MRRYRTTGTASSQLQRPKKEYRRLIHQDNMDTAYIASTAATGTTDAAVVAVEVVVQRTMGYIDTIRTCYDTQQQITGDQVLTVLQTKYPSTDSSNKSLQCLRGKVRDRYLLIHKNNDENTTTTTTSDAATSNSTNTIALVTTDRQSGFDRNLAIVPYKGAVLNLCSYYWFQQTQDIISNHIVSVPHPNVTIAKQCQPFPIEFVVRYVKQT